MSRAKRKPFCVATADFLSAFCGRQCDKQQTFKNQVHITFDFIKIYLNLPINYFRFSPFSNQLQSNQVTACQILLFPGKKIDYYFFKLVFQAMINLQPKSLLLFDFLQD